MPSDQRWRKAILRPSATINEAIFNLEDTAIKIILIVDDYGVFEGTISDGDIRRGLLRGLDLSSSIAPLIQRNAIVVPSNIGRDSIRLIMAANKIHQIPVVDEANHIVGLHLWDEVIESPLRHNPMVIMAGGKGTRLRPQTENCPKPMLEIAGKPMLEHIIERAKLEGFSNFVIATNYLAHVIENYFGNGNRLDIHIDYLRETSPLGTAGALSLFNTLPDMPFLVTNGDVMTDIRYGEVLDFHVRNSALGTMAVRIHEWQHPFGVVNMDGIEIKGFEEKPISRTHINAGIYALDPFVLSLLEANSPCDMPTLFERLQALGKRTVAYPMHEPWLDVGRPTDLKLANSQYKNRMDGNKHD